MSYFRFKLLDIEAAFDPKDARKASRSGRLTRDLLIKVAVQLLVSLLVELLT
jgi:hypothetical protein